MESRGPEGGGPGAAATPLPELAAKILVLRARGLPWNMVAQHAGLPVGTRRKVRPPPGPQPVAWKKVRRVWSTLKGLPASPLNRKAQVPGVARLIR